MLVGGFEPRPDLFVLLYKLLISCYPDICFFAFVSTVGTIDLRIGPVCACGALRFRGLLCVLKRRYF